MEFLAREVFDQIHYEHHTIMKTIDRLEKTSAQDTERRQALLTELRNEFVPHMAAKEQVFYPLVEDGDRVTMHRLKAQEDLVTARHVLDRLLQTPPTDEHFLPRLSVFKDLLKETVSEDELHNFITARLKLTNQQSTDLLNQYKAAEDHFRQQLTTGQSRTS